MMTPFESAVRGSLEGSHGGRVIVDDELGHRALHHHAGLNRRINTQASCSGRRWSAIPARADWASARSRPGRLYRRDGRAGSSN